MKRKFILFIILLIVALVFYGLKDKKAATYIAKKSKIKLNQNVKTQKIIQFKPRNKNEAFLMRLATSANDLTLYEVEYDPAYVRIKYPGGDVPKNKGVCTDVIIRAYRKLGIDLQRNVHEDMKINFNLYPRKYGLSRTDTNIDHRRVPNLMVFFKRKGDSLPITDNAEDYKPGDLVVWDFENGLTHIGIVSSAQSSETSRFMIIHNVGSGQVQEDVLFDWKIIGHYRYYGKG